MTPWSLLCGNYQRRQRGFGEQIFRRRLFCVWRPKQLERKLVSIQKQKSNGRTLRQMCGDALVLFQNDPDRLEPYMDYTLIIGLIVASAVCFFAYQWMTKRNNVLRPSTEAPPPAPENTLGGVAVEAEVEGSGPAPPKQQQQQQQTEMVQTQTQTRMPTPTLSVTEVNGQGQGQQGQGMSQGQQGGMGFGLVQGQGQQGQGQQGQGQQGMGQGQGGQGQGQQGFSPEMAQNNGLLLGNAVFAFDGMEQSGLTPF
jgi:hypothetical protein